MSPSYFYVIFRMTELRTTVPAHICTLLVLDDDGCTGIVPATIDCNGTANQQDFTSAK